MKRPWSEFLLTRLCRLKGEPYQRATRLFARGLDQSLHDEEAMLQSFQSHPAPEMSTAFDIIAAALNNDETGLRLRNLI